MPAEVIDTIISFFAPECDRQTYLDIISVSPVFHESMRRHYFKNTIAGYWQGVVVNAQHLAQAPKAVRCAVQRLTVQEYAFSIPPAPFIWDLPNLVHLSIDQLEPNLDIAPCICGLMKLQTLQLCSKWSRDTAPFVLPPPVSIA
jgi:hypothetical protein